MSSLLRPTPLSLLSARDKRVPPALGETSKAGMGMLGKRSPRREALGALSTNVRRLPPSAPHPIPKPAATPDVFADEPRSGKRRDAPAPASASLHKRAKLDAAATAAASRNLREESERWLAKWRKVFPTLVFHFELGIDEGVRRDLRARVMGAGATIDNFFSQHVSHLVVKSVPSPKKPKPSQAARRGHAGPVRESPKNPFLDTTGPSNLVDKAETLGIKVWTVHKLTEMLNQLAPVKTAVDDSLSHLLEDERLHGTRERDASAPRPDYYYFRPGNKYVLVEDATARARPIMIKEYAHKDGPDWPVLFENFLRPGAASCFHVAPDQIRERAWTLYVDRSPYHHEQPPASSEDAANASAGGGAGAVRRSQSLRALSTNLPALVPEAAAPYEAASGNSVVLTSNIASTSTASNTPGANGIGGLHALGAHKDRAIAQMSRRVQVLKGNARRHAPGSLALASSTAPSPADRRAPPAAAASSPAWPTPAAPAYRRASTGMPPPAPPVKEFMTQDQVVAMLRLLREPAEHTRPTTEQRRRNREKVDADLKRKEQDTAAGYCENCRLRYTDLSVHIASRKHRRFAQNNDHFADLDITLGVLQRPPHPSTLAPVAFPPCRARHGKDDYCPTCVLDDESEGEASAADASDGSDAGEGSEAPSSQQSAGSAHSEQGAEDASEDGQSEGGEHSGDDADDSGELVAYGWSEDAELADA
ncbi:Cdc7p-Dbf4p kinase complex regulatory subunit [Cryptotrichosporon argae]